MNDKIMTSVLLSKDVMDYLREIKKKTNKSVSVQIDEAVRYRRYCESEDNDDD